MTTRKVLVFAAALAGAAPALAQLSATNAIKMNDAPFYMCGAQMGWAVGNGGNLDKDARGIDDILIGAPNGELAQPANGNPCPLQHGHASAWRSLPLRLWRQLGQLYPSVPTTSRIGTSVKGIGDVNGDGYEDAVVPEFNFEILPIYPGRICVRSGFDGSILASVTPNPSAQEQPGTMVAAIGDVDGYPGSEIAVLAPMEFNLSGTQGRVYLYSYRSGSLVLLARWEGKAAAFEWAAGPIGAVGDANGDGFGDLAIVFQPSFAPAVMRVYSGASPYKQIGPDFTNFLNYLGYVSLPGSGPHGPTTGEYIAPLTDLNGDGKAEFIVGAQGGESGRVIAMVMGATPINGTAPTQWTLHHVMEHPVGDALPLSGHRSVAAVPPGEIWEVLVGISYMNQTGMAYAFKAATGGFLRSYIPEPAVIGYDPSIGFGCAVAGGDFNGDGLGDAVVGCHDFDLDPGFPGLHGQAYLFLGTP